MRHLAHLLGLGCAAALTLSACGDDAPGPPPIDPAERFAALSAEMEDFLETRAIPGASLAVVWEGEITTAAFGLRHMDRPDLPVTPDTHFHLFSITKPMTALALFRLADEGRLSLDTPVDTLVSDFTLSEPSSAPITTHHLLTHTSGLPDDTPLTNPSWSRCDTSIATHWEETTLTPWLPTGLAHLYSNQGYNLAGAVVEAAGEAPYPDLLEGLLFAPLGMTGISFDNAVVAERSYAHPHIRRDNGSLSPRDLDLHGCPFQAPAMGAIGDAESVARFALFLMQGDATVLSEAARSEALSPQVPTLERPDGFYGYGLEHQTYKGLDVIFHSGRGLGTRAMMMMVPSRGFAVVTLYNVQDADPKAMAFRAIDLYLAPEGQEPPEDWSTPPQTWADYEGTWHSDGLLDGTVITVDAERRLLVASVFGGLIDVELHQVAHDHFEGEFPTAGIVGVVFLRDETGAVTHLLSRAGVATR